MILEIAASASRQASFGAIQIAWYHEFVQITAFGIFIMFVFVPAVAFVAYKASKSGYRMGKLTAPGAHDHSEQPSDPQQQI